MTERRRVRAIYDRRVPAYDRTVGLGERLLVGDLRRRFMTRLPAYALSEAGSVLLSGNGRSARMAIDHKQRHQTIAVGPEADLAQILDLAHDAPVVIERNGVRFRVERDAQDTATPRDPDAFRDALRRSAGTLAGIDGEQLKRDLRRQRGHADDVDGV